MQEQMDGLQRLEVLRKLNVKDSWLNSDVYRLLFKPELYILAYERMKSRPGNMTSGPDTSTIDGIGMETIKALIQELRSEKYRPKPTRTIYTLKNNGRQRRLGVPTFRDKLVQEVIRLILKVWFMIALINHTLRSAVMASGNLVTVIVL